MKKVRSRLHDYGAPFWRKFEYEPDDLFGYKLSSISVHQTHAIVVIEMSNIKSEFQHVNTKWDGLQFL